MRGVEHRQAQTCSRCGSTFYWTPRLGLCPYCDLSPRARSGGYEEAEPCPPDCCPPAA